MSPQLRFTENQLGVTMIRPESFRLYEMDGNYVLPTVVLHADTDDEATVQSLYVEAVDGAPGTLGSWLKDNWVADSPVGRHIAGTVEIARSAVIPAVVVAQNLPAGVPGEASRGRVMVTWRLSTTDAANRPTEDHSQVLLDFAPAGSQPVPPARPWTTPAVGHRNGPSLNTFAAIDFGTSSSTVTFYDTRRPNQYLLDPGQTVALADQLATLLLDSPPSGSTAESEWQEARVVLETALAQRLGTSGPVGLDGCVQALQNRNVRLDLVNVVCAELERLLWSRPGELGRWLAAGLHEAYDKSFRVPALTASRLRPVVFDELNRLYDTPSELTVTQPAPLRTEFLSPGSGDKKQVVRDLKRLFIDGAENPVPGMRHPDDTDVLVEHLVAWFYEHLTKHTEIFAHDSDHAEMATLPRLVLTYPTTTTPANRLRLQRVVKDALDLNDVVTAYDEGVAAGLYFLMRDFSGVSAIGVEALRANSQRLDNPADDGPPRWRQVMLVLDIGGGTTDIALIGLTLIDITREMPEVDPSVRGRYYRIEPEVLGSTGHQMLGGHHLTLRVFYWLKAAIIDAMTAHGLDSATRDRLVESLPPQFRAEDDGASRLGEAMVNSDGEEPAPDDVIEELRTKLDTRFKPEDGPTEQAAFFHLWKEAEKAKISLGQGVPYVMQAIAIKDFLDLIANSDQNLDELVPESGVSLDPDSFHKLVRPLLVQAVDLADHLARSRLPRLEKGRLDRIMLSGKSSLMPLVKELVEERLVRRASRYVPEGDQAATIRQPTVEVEETHAKQAASLGAAWARSVVQFAPPVPDAKEVRIGKTIVDISVDNLFTALPGSFFLHLPEGRRKILEVGTPFVELDRPGSLGARTEEWIPLPLSFEVQREMGPDQMLRWGHYTFADHAHKLGFAYNPAVWDRSSGVTPTMCAQLELDQFCFPKLHLCNHGRPHYVSHGRPISLSALRAVETDPDGRLTKLPKLVVRTGGADAHDPLREEVLVEGGDLTVLGAMTRVFPLFVHVADDPDTDAVPALAVALPPVSPVTRVYSFAAVDEFGQESRIGELPAPGQPGHRVSYRLIVTAEGVLRVHRGALPYLRAASMEEVQSRDGTVLTVEIDLDRNRLTPNWLPFNGTH